VVIDTRNPQLDRRELQAMETLGSSEALGARGGDPAEWRDRVAALRADDVGTVVFTPGTTGAAKGVQLTHGNLVAAADAGVAAYGLAADDEIVSSLPLAEISERTLCAVAAVAAGCTVNFGEGGGSLLGDLREAEPAGASASSALEYSIAGRAAAQRRPRPERCSAPGEAAVDARRPRHPPLRRRRRAAPVRSRRPRRHRPTAEWWRTVGVPLRGVRHRRAAVPWHRRRRHPSARAGGKCPASRCGSKGRSG
jgi:hypothetical protein